MQWHENWFGSDMTYTADDKNLASIAKMLPTEAMAVWCETATQAADMGLDHNACVMAAWNEVGKTWQRPPTGKKWIAKDSPDAGSVHVDAPLGSDGKRKKKPASASADGYDCADGGAEMMGKFETSPQVVKVDAKLGIVFGFAIVCKKDGQDYYDLQDDHIPEDSMLKAASDFMLESRVAGDMHARDDNENPVPAGDIVFAFPLTTDVAKALDIQTAQTGLLIGYKPWDKGILAKYESGEYSGFSIGGSRIKDETVA